MKEIFSRRLRAARSRAGLSLRDLSLKMGNSVTYQMIGKYEKGESLPGSDVIIKLSEAFGVSVDYFFKPYDYALKSVEFRKSSKLKSQKAKDMLTQNVISAYENFAEIESILGIRDEFIPPFQSKAVSHLHDIEELALSLRKEWELGAGAIPNLIDTFENKNLKVFEITHDFDVKEFDGMAGYINNQPIIALNSKLDTVRKRFTALHELGHLLLQFDESVQDTDKEKMCHAFAGAVLLPESAAIEYFSNKRKRVAIHELIEVKELYGISVQAALFRLKVLNIISQLEFQTYFKNIRSKGLSDESRLGNYMGVEKCTKMERLVLRAVSEEIISMSKGAELLSIELNTLREMLREI